jgi:hypothetical protein
MIVTNAGCGERSHRYNRTFGLLAREGTAMIRPWQAVILVGTAIIVGLVAYWYLAPRETSFGMFDEDGATGNFRFALTFIATLIGVALGSIYRELKDLQAQGIRTIPELKPFFSEVGRSTDLWLGLAGSPIVYGLLLQASNGMSLPGLIVVALRLARQSRGGRHGELRGVLAFQVKCQSPLRSIESAPAGAAAQNNILEISWIAAGQSGLEHAVCREIDQADRGLQEALGMGAGLVGI